MLRDQNIILRTHWGLLIFFSSVLTVGVIQILRSILVQFAVPNIIVLLLLVVGLVLLVLGFFLTKRAHYEVYPTHVQVFGAVINGVLLATALVMLLLSILIAPGTSLMLIALASAIEFLAIRLSQSRQLTIARVFALLLLIGSIYMTAVTSLSLAKLVYIFIGALVLKEVFGRYTKTYLLSSWVNSIWHGVVFVVLGLVGGLIWPVNVALSGVLTLPIWVGFVALSIGVTVVLLQFLKRKIIIAVGYLQHKVQLWTLLLALGAYWFAGIEVVPIFLLLIVLYSVSEKTLFPKT